MANNPGNVLMEGVQLIFRNFSGREGKYNQAGSREFGVLLPTPELAADMAEDGWNVKFLKPRERDADDEVYDPEDDAPRPWIPVAVSYKVRPPRVVMITHRGRTNLDEDSVGLLDWADIARDPETGNPLVDLIINPYAWTMNGKTGTKAYLKAIYITIDEDALDLKYGHLDEVNADGTDVLTPEEGPE